MANSIFETLRDPLSSITVPYIDPDLLRDHKLADRQYEILCKYIDEFQSNLNEDEEVCMKLASFGQNILLHVSGIGYANPSIITFYGYVNGQYCELIQHVNQLSFLLMSCPKSEPDKPARRIGFNFSEE